MSKVHGVVLSERNLDKICAFTYQCIHSQGAEGGLGRPGSVSADPGSDQCSGPVSLPVVPAAAVTALHQWTGWLVELETKSRSYQTLLPLLD